MSHTKLLFSPSILSVVNSIDPLCLYHLILTRVVEATNYARPRHCGCDFEPCQRVSQQVATIFAIRRQT